MTTPPTLPTAHEEQSEQFQVRAAKRARMLETGVEPYPADLPISSTISEVRSKWDGKLAEGEEHESELVGIAGRVMYLRNTGKLCFVTLQQGDGATIQAMLSLAAVGEESLADFKADVDLGDILFVHGHVGSSKRGELSVFAKPGEAAPAWQIASKSLRPLPKTYENEAGEQVTLSDEGRVRNRHLDLIMRPAARNMVRARAAVMRSLRNTLDAQGFLELDTPLLQTLPGGAAARPFITHMNAYDIDLYLRIAPELFLKRAVVGGIERVYEINRNFRNEGADSTHSPEFSAIEVYEAYGNYETMATLTREMVQQAARDAFGTERLTLADGSEYDISGEWARIDLIESLSAALGREINPLMSRDELAKISESVEVPVKDHYSAGKIIEEMFEELVGHALWEPTFVFDYPIETSPLTRGHRTRPGLTEKWDLYARGYELATAYSELVDPVIQRERLEEQARAGAAGDTEAMLLDEDFLAAMEQAMPPSGGMGMGVDRLLMTFTGLGIRETIPFPLVKPL